MMSMAAISTPVHHHHTYITSIQHGNVTKGGGGLETRCVLSPGMFSFLYITTTYLAWNEPMNGQNKTEMGGA